MSPTAPPLRTSIRLNNDLAPGAFAELAQVAERVGFDQVWYSNDLFLRSAPVVLAVAAERTIRIGLGAGIMNPYTVHPSELAMLAATLAEVSDGRFLLGLGAGAEEFLAWAGVGRPQPLARTRAAVDAVRALLDGGSPAPDDVWEWRPEARLHAPPAARVPIYLGVMSPRMLALAGERCDGALPLLFPPEHWTVAQAQAQVGLASSGRPSSAFDLAACVWVSVDEDVDRAQLLLAEKIAYYGPSFAPYLLERAGLSLADFDGVTAELRSSGIAAAARLVTPEMLRLGIAGGPEEVIARCTWLIDNGARHVSFGPPLGADPAAAVELLGTEVLPALRRHAEGTIHGDR